MIARPIIALTVVTMTLTLTSCGNTASTSGPSAARTPGEGTTTYPLTMNNCGTDNSFARTPERVVVMNGGSVAESSSLIALGQEARVVANAQSYGTSDVAGRAEAIKRLPSGGITLDNQQDISREAMLGLRPDLVISTYGGGFKSDAGYASREDLKKIGANTYVPPSACASDGMIAGSPTIDSSYQLLRDLGRIFDASKRAEQVIAESKSKVDAVAVKVAGRPMKNVLVVFPGMGAADFSSIAAVGIWNDILGKAGAKNPFVTASTSAFATVSKETLASTPIDAVIVVNYMNPNPESAAGKILDQFPQWEATKNRRALTLSDSIYFGPDNDVAVDKIARLIHGDAF
jgi:iron complex transport system substrate-binding protein